MTRNGHRLRQGTWGLLRPHPIKPIVSAGMISGRMSGNEYVTMGIFWAFLFLVVRHVRSPKQMPEQSY